MVEAAESEPPDRFQDQIRPLGSHRLSGAEFGRKLDQEPQRGKFHPVTAAALTPFLFTLYERRAKYASAGIAPFALVLGWLGSTRGFAITAVEHA
ncbi:MAG TPA: hypothetical protein VFJ82_03520 [Longimicrobium sp.]|nr:hypothetical protein [Longimicrobium sp.]